MRWLLGSRCTPSRQHQSCPWTLLVLNHCVTLLSRSRPAGEPEPRAVGICLLYPGLRGMYCGSPSSRLRRVCAPPSRRGPMGEGGAMSVAELDATKREAFAGRMIEVVNDTCLGLMAGLGHETGLFDTMAGMAPATSEDIARAAGLNERYVREWLGAMVTGGIVDYEPEQATYALPPEHAVSLTRAAGPDNLARIAQDFGMMGEVEQQVAEAFR